jgi:predicted RND superfamily exporter protein
MPHAWDAVVSIKDFERRKINEVLDDQWEKSGKVATLGRGTQASGSHVWMDTQLSLVSSSLIGLAVSFVLSFLVLVVATRSFVASLISILAILGIVAVVLGSMVLGGRNLGFMESICVTVVVGLAVDYVVHYGIAFVEHFEEFEEGKGGGKKRERNAVHAAVIGALTDLGVSVLGGATSTFGAALFLLFCVIK